jgi:hypothetical protein
MRTTAVPPALRERLGHDATIGLLEFTEGQQTEWSEHMLSISVERFERRLAEELAELRVGLAREIHDGRVETIKWVFLFWAGQMTAFVGLVALLFRVTGH